MRITHRIVALFAAAALAAPLAPAQDAGPFSPPPAAAVSQPELDQMLAPIALYPDALLSQVLMASTYPLEVVALQRWLDRNPNLQGEALAQALEREPWDTSVKALAPFPRLARMMSEQLEWTQRLGNAFLVQQEAVMDTVQRLREKALEAGTLRDDSRERVDVDAQGMVIIEPASPDVVYVPAYDPAVVYGPWWWPGYPPYSWAWYDGPWAFWVGGIGFGYGVAVGGGWYGHHWHADWHDHHMHEGRGGGTWHHDPGHRGGVAYPDDRTRQRFGGYDSGNREARRDFRGFDMRPGNASSRGASQPFAREPAQRSTPSLPRSALDPQRRDASRAQSERGHSSLGGTAHPFSRPSAPPASHRNAPASHGSAPASHGSPPASHGSPPASHGSAPAHSGTSRGGTRR